MYEQHYTDLVVCVFIYVTITTEEVMKNLGEWESQKELKGAGVYKWYEYSAHA